MVRKEKAGRSGGQKWGEEERDGSEWFFVNRRVTAKRPEKEH